MFRSLDGPGRAAAGAVGRGFSALTMARRRASERRSETVEDFLGQLRGILASEGKDSRSLLYREIVLNALKCKRDELDVLDLKVINRAVSEFRYAARVFKPYRRVRKVSVFGSARVPAGAPYYELAVQFARLLAQHGWMVITGAAEGIMRAGIEGAGPENSFGVNILLPFEAGPAKVIQDDPKLVSFRYFFTRKIFFVMEADAFALFPGGFGTHDEAFEVLTLVQTGKARPMPLVLMELRGERYWESWDAFVRRELLARGFIAPEDLSFYKIAHSPEEGLGWIRFYYSTYHSLRYVGSRVVIRLEKELLDEQIEELNEQFRDVIESGEITKTSALFEEEGEPDLMQKPRIVFSHNRKSAGRLNEMILTVNRMGQAV